MENECDYTYFLESMQYCKLPNLSCFYKGKKVYIQLPTEVNSSKSLVYLCNLNTLENKVVEDKDETKDA